MSDTGTVMLANLLTIQNAQSVLLRMQLLSYSIVQRARTFWRIRITIIINGCLKFDQQELKPRSECDKIEN